MNERKTFNINHIQADVFEIKKYIDRKLKQYASPESFNTIKTPGPVEPQRHLIRDHRQHHLVLESLGLLQKRTSEPGNSRPERKRSNLCLWSGVRRGLGEQDEELLKT